MRYRTNSEGGTGVPEEGCVCADLGQEYGIMQTKPWTTNSAFISSLMSLRKVHTNQTASFYQLITASLSDFDLRTVYIVLVVFEEAI